MKELFLADEAATLAFGAELARSCPARAIIFLKGDLGAGKTTLVRGFLHELGYTGTVKSPTYTLVEPYTIADKQVFHFDLYRLNHPAELENIGLRDYLSVPAILLIEWPERGEDQLPEPDTIIEIKMEKTGRKLSINSNNL